MQGLDDTAFRQLQTGNRRAIKINVLDVAASGDIYRLRQQRAVPDIDGPQQLVVAQIQFRQIPVGIRCAGITDLQALQFHGFGEIRVTNHQAGKVSDRGKLGCAVDIDFCVVHVIQRARQRGLGISGRACLHQIGTVLNRRIDVSVRLHRDICLGVPTDGDDIRQAVTGIVLGVDITEAVIEPPLPLFCLGPLQHGQVGGVALLHQRSQVFKPGILIEDRLRPLSLMLFKHLLDLFIRNSAGRPESLVHGFHLIKKGSSHVLPKN